MTLKSKSNFWMETVPFSVPERNLELFHVLIKHVQSLVAVSRFLQASIFDNSINNEQDEECEHFWNFNYKGIFTALFYIFSFILHILKCILSINETVIL